MPDLLEFDHDGRLIRCEACSAGAFPTASSEASYQLAWLCGVDGGEEVLAFQTASNETKEKVKGRATAWYEGANPRTDSG